MRFKDDCSECNSEHHLPARDFTVNLRTNTYEFKCPRCERMVMYGAPVGMIVMMAENGTRLSKTDRLE